MKDLIEVKRLTVIDIIDNESDSLSSSCSCMKPTPNITSKDKKQDERPCIYTQEFMSVIKENKALDFNKVCHAAHGLSLLLIAEYDCVEEESEEQINDENGRVIVNTTKTKTKSSHLLFDAGPDPNIWSANVKKLGIDLGSIETIVLSHYHVDHSNGLRAAVRQIYEARSTTTNSLEKEEMADPSIIVDLHSSKIVSRGMKVSIYCFGSRLPFFDFTH